MSTAGEPLVDLRAGDGATERVIVARGPFSWPLALEVVESFGPTGRHARGSVDPVRMSFILDRSLEPVGAAVHAADEGLRVAVSGTSDVDGAARQVARIFSLDHDATGFAALGERDPAFGAIQSALAGLRPVCFVSPYECAAWAVLSQRISMRQAAAIQDRLAAAHGERITVAGEEVRAFPTPERLLAIEAVPSLPDEKIARLHAVARAALDGLLDVDRLRALGPEDAPAALRSIRGIGAFWSSGIYLRACGIVDAWPDEPISIAALGALHGLGDQPSPPDLERLTDAFRPYRMWAAFLLRVAANRGLIPGVHGREMRIREAAGGSGRSGRAGRPPRGQRAGAAS